jgi:predicted O-methyltransferase YrrM
MYQIIEYLKFVFRSTNQHGVHSPFIYDLVTKCFYDKTIYPDYLKINYFRQSLLKNHQTIEVTDFGSGSKVFSSNKRTVKRIAKTSGTTHKRAKLLYRLISYFNTSTVLELGTSLGIGTYAMALTNSKTKIVSIEGCPEISKFTNNLLQANRIDNVELKTGSFAEVIPTLDETRWDLIFFDGHHDKDATVKYFEQLLTSIHNDSVFIFDDIHWSKGMTEAWKTIKKHPQVTVTIDTFFWGFVFFRTEQVKEDFLIRL